MWRNACRANLEDLQEILELQYPAYQSEAKLFRSRDIPPLKQTFDEVINEYYEGIILKMIDNSGHIIGSVRAKAFRHNVVAHQQELRSDSCRGMCDIPLFD